MDSSVKKFLQRPLIIGASVSGDYFVESPGKILAQRYTTSDHIKVMAQKGRSGKLSIKEVNDKSIQERTAVIGIDLFFWDSFISSSTESISQMEKLIAMTAKYNIPLVLGEIPVFYSPRQPTADILNLKMKQLCKSNKGCHILPLNDFLIKTLTDGFLLYKKKKYSIQDLMPDGLHIARPASEYLADEIEKLLSVTQ